ncbi:hypothetical protein M878_30135 [Streptomyces roseochromogenus subsp. oscitans DS 12.976]|uniref:Uncharacterized protein n=2 Tax=Streptomyces roseochromogenus TaxID=285450 RepID=V6JXY0_STRRC|nr:hypothetical protein M878_30135 [Streptomyces roseochromogenus subsp. oscitans DS 12.976]
MLAEAGPCVIDFGVSRTAEPTGADAPPFSAPARHPSSVGARWFGHAGDTPMVSRVW